MQQKHAAALVSGGKVLAVSVNKVKNCHKQDVRSLSQHAERGVCESILWGKDRSCQQAP